MLYRAIQVICILLLAGIAYAFNMGIEGVGGLLGGTFHAGVLVGAGAVLLVYALIMWIDPSSRPRGSFGGDQGPDDRTY